MDDVAIIIAVSGAIGTAAGYILKYLTESKTVEISAKTVDLTAQELFDKRRSEFHEEIASAIKREQEELQREREAHQSCREHNQELRMLLWRAITKAEEAMDEAESNVIHLESKWNRS